MIVELNAGYLSAFFSSSFSFSSSSRVLLRRAASRFRLLCGRLRRREQDAKECGGQD
jgi:hypothetical protein